MIVGARRARLEWRYGDWGAAQREARGVCVRETPRTRAHILIPEEPVFHK